MIVNLFALACTAKQIYYLLNSNAKLLNNRLSHVVQWSALRERTNIPFDCTLEKQKEDKSGSNLYNQISGSRNVTEPRKLLR